VVNHVGSLLRRRCCLLKGERTSFALMLVSCNAILVHVLRVKHLPLLVCVLVERKELPPVALIGSLILPVVSAVISFLIADDIAVKMLAMWVLVILVRC
jgi:hypothetical protein